MTTVTVDGVQTQTRWFGPAQQPLFAVIHQPASGRVRGGVVLCPPIASELNFSHLLLRTLALRLAARGLLVVRFDYAGTGQSAGALNDPGRARAYLDSIAEAVALARAVGGDWVAGAGLRFGGTLLAAAVDAGTELDALALWDPCLSGRGFLREQRTLLAASGAPVSDPAEGTELAGYLYTPRTSADLGAVQLPETLSGLRGEAIVILDDERPGAQRIRGRLERAVTHWAGYHLEGPLLDTGLVAHTLPEPALTPVLAWLDAQAPVDDHPLGGDSPPAGSEPTAAGGAAVVAHNEDGAPVEERMLRLGDARLFAIETRGQVRDDSPPIVFLSIAAEPSIGPGRMWVDLARALAQQGYRCLRVDLSGIGESEPRPGEPVRVIYSGTVLADVRDVCAAAVETSSAGPVLVGVCSGAYAILSTASLVPVSAAVAINPYLTLRALEHWWTPDTPVSGDAPAGRRGLAVDVRGAALTSLRRLMPRLRRLGRNQTWREQLLDRFPTVAWLVLSRLGVTFSPARLIDPILDAGVPLLLVSGDKEGRQALRRAPRAFRRLSRAPRSRFAFVPEIDHSLRVIDSRRQVTEAIGDFLAALPLTPDVPVDAFLSPSTDAEPDLEPNLLKVGVLR